MKAIKKPIEVSIYHYNHNAMMPEFLHFLESLTDEKLSYNEETKSIFIHKDRGDIELKYGNSVIHETETDNQLWAIDKEIFKQTYTRVPNTVYRYKKRVYEIEFIELSDLETRTIVEVLNFLGKSATTVPQILTRDDYIDTVKTQGYLEIDTLEGVEKSLSEM